MPNPSQRGSEATVGSRRPLPLDEAGLRTAGPACRHPGRRGSRFFAIRHAVRPSRVRVVIDQGRFWRESPRGHVRRDLLRLLEFVGKRMNSDGGRPAVGRTKRLWDCFHERGVVCRSFNAKRFAWIRRFLDGAGLVEVGDPTYVIGERAAKWSPSERFWELASSLDKEGEGGTILVGNVFCNRPSRVLGELQGSGSTALAKNSLP